jgi:hypoxanthine phosphoribosyltransferase
MSHPSPVKTLLAAEKIEARVRELGAQIASDYTGKNLVCIAILNGSFMFFADLVRAIPLTLRCDFLLPTSYAEHQKYGRSGEVKILLDVEGTLEGSDVLLVEDLVNTGLTLRFLRDTLAARKPSSIKTCSLLFKSSGPAPLLRPDYIGFEIPQSFVVGYGLDHHGRYRELPFVGTLNEGRPA